MKKISSLLLSSNLISLLGISLLLFYIYCSVDYLNHHVYFFDFNIFYKAAKALKMGNNIFSATDGRYIYPPLLAYLLIPFAHLSPKMANTLWLIINFVLLITVLTVGFRLFASALKVEFRAWQALAICSLTILLSYHELWWELKQGQTDLLVLTGIMLFMYFIDTKSFLAGIFLGMVAVIKYQTILFLPFLICRCRWRAVAGMLTGILTGAFLPAITLGWQKNWLFLQIAIKSLIQMPGDHTNLLPQYATKVPQLTWKGNISITSGLARVFLNHHLSLHSSFILTGTIALTTFLFIALLFKQKKIDFLVRNASQLTDHSNEQPVILLESAIFIALILIFSPQCIMRHLILLIPLHLFASILLLIPREGVKLWYILFGMLFFQMGKLADDLIIHPLGLQWGYFGGSCWCLLLGLPFLVWAGLSYLSVTIPQSRLSENWIFLRS